MNIARVIQLISFAVLVLPAVALADIYRCVLPSGAIEYQAVACAEGMAETIISGRNTVAPEPVPNLLRTDEQGKELPVTKQEERTFWQREVITADVRTNIEKAKSANAFMQRDTSCREMEWARAVHSYLLEATSAREVAGEAVYTIRPQNWQTIRLHLPQFIKAATYADTCVTGGARPVRFYSPEGDPIGL